jgi:hypothetical protein
MVPSLLISLRFWNRFDSSQQENVPHNPQQQDYCCGHEGGGEGARSGDDVAGNDGAEIAAI